MVDTKCIVRSDFSRIGVIRSRIHFCLVKETLLFAVRKNDRVYIGYS